MIKKMHLAYYLKLVNEHPIMWVPIIIWANCMKKKAKRKKPFEIYQKGMAAARAIKRYACSF
jgi:hypothetical protein